MKCPCGSSKSYESCCAPIHAGAEIAATAEACMRARYSAFVKHEIDFLLSTIAPETREEGERSEIEKWSRESQWLGLHVRETQGGGPEDTKGTVEFVARFAQHGQENLHHELATFEKRDGVWLFVDGTTPEAKTVVREGQKVGRNEPCPCGSGKKYKKCCGS